MTEFAEVKKFSIPAPNDWTCFGSPVHFENLPQIHKDQIFFLNINASNQVLDFLRNSGMINGYGQSKYHPLTWQPFLPTYFQSIKKLFLLYNEKEVKKWLFDSHIRFKQNVFLITDSEYVVFTSWKIIVKYSNIIFAKNYAIVFDESRNWCLYNGNGQLYFGENNMSYKSAKAKSFKVIESYNLAKIGLLVSFDCGNALLKKDDILFSNSTASEWTVIKEYNPTADPSTLFLHTNNVNARGKFYLLMATGGNHRPTKGEILLLKD
ncbi:hypothetical protein [Dyadobacter sp. CY326]|uniref:hypothetical protein n=1 Tax=Dyadobacter sp. CY326 TaxID=2907300 RepID=UPI001F3B55E2|nr:hypothetical protein [Dyadobacter sp. CY326]MCE7064506.1 hypothetical protein [Dyadobacter sp. CY326]